VRPGELLGSSRGVLEDVDRREDDDPHDGWPLHQAETRYGILSEQARAGKVTAAIALVRALKDEDEPTIDDALDRILGGE
jgi:hypothetical protein